MSYVRVIDGSIHDWREQLPESEELLTNPGVAVAALRFQPKLTQQATGWYEVVAGQRPPDTETHTSNRSIEMVDGTPTETWAKRMWTLDELQAKEAAANGERLAGEVADNIEPLLADKAAGSRGEVTVEALAAQVASLTAQVVRLSRLQSGRLDSTDCGAEE